MDKDFDTKLNVLFFVFQVLNTDLYVPYLYVLCLKNADIKNNNWQLLKNVAVNCKYKM